MVLDFTARLVARVVEEIMDTLSMAHVLLNVDFTLYDMQDYNEAVKEGVLKAINALEGYSAEDYRDGEIMVKMVETP